MNERGTLTVTLQKLLHRKAYANIRKILKKTHNADLALILQSIGTHEAFTVFNLQPSLEEKADLLSYLDKNLQKFIFTQLNEEESAQLVRKMESDDAADLLGHLSDEITKTIIEGLDSKESTEVVGLMGYAEESAGGIMNSDYLAFPEGATVGEVVQALQGEEAENKVTFYVYVVNRGGHLVGVVSLKQLLLSRKGAALKDLMTTNVISVPIDIDQEYVADTVARYDFLSIPVVDENNRLVGVITVDDVIDVIRQEAEEDLLSMAQAGWGIDMSWVEHILARLPWLLLAFLAGGICFSLIYFGRSLESLSVEDREMWAVAGIVPLVLSLGAMVGNQAATVLLGALQTGQFWGGKLWAHIFRELGTAIILAVFFGGLVFLSSYVALPELGLYWVFATALGGQIFLATMLGISLPLVIRRLGWDPLALTPPFYSALADISSVLILFGIFNAQ